MDIQSFEYGIVSSLFLGTFAIKNKFCKAEESKLPKIVSIKKLENKRIQTKFANELKIDFETFNEKQPDQIIKLLFHGTSKTDPKEIYESDEGLDIRFSKFGMYGQGIYFADNSRYSHKYAYKKVIDGV